jgi:folate-dependent phosphoribosylglycinamide formyltransferase PurN
MFHNSDECYNFLKNEKFDLGIILGARILNDNIISQFKIGIINIHPALLPFQRGLDSIKWSILKGFRLGATSHFINKNIDKGVLIERKEIEIYNDDTLLDIT